MKKGNGFVTRAIIVIAVIVLLFSAFKMKEILDDYRTSEVSYEEAVETFVKEMPEIKEDNEKVRMIDFAGLQAINSDVIGWIELEGSNIDYPILKSSDNADYLHTTYDKKYASAGSIFMDCRNASDFSDHNTILYGHNMKNGSMFHDLRFYMTEGSDWYESHNVYKIYTVDKKTRQSVCTEYKVISVQKTDAYSESYKVSFSGLDDYESWLKNICKDAIYDATYDIHKGTITLSTCRGKVGSDERLVVHLQEM